MANTKPVDTDFYYPSEADARRYEDRGDNDVSHGVYLDYELRRVAEEQRAKVEGREPNLENPPATVGTPLVQLGQLNPEHRPVHAKHVAGARLAVVPDQSVGHQPFPAANVDGPTSPGTTNKEAAASKTTTK